MKNRKPFEVLGIEPKQYGNEIAGGDSVSLKEFTTKKEAFNFALKESKKAKWHEITVYLYDEDNEIDGHWYFKNGKLTHTMF